MTGKKDARSRRNVLKTFGAVSTGLVDVHSIPTVGNANPTVCSIQSEDGFTTQCGGGGGGGGQKTWSQNDATDLGKGYKFHLGSGLEAFELDGSSSEFRIAGDYCCLKNGELPPGLGEPPRLAESPTSQRIWIVNESPDALSVFTSSNSNEVAMHPKPNNHDSGSYDEAFNVVTAAASVAATAASALMSL